MNTSTLKTLAQRLAGKFENQAQAIEQPIWYVHLNLWHRPLPIAIEGHMALFAEQASVVNPNFPYRQRVIVLKPSGFSQNCTVQYLAFKEPEKFRGAGENPHLLDALSLEDLEHLPGCLLSVISQDNRSIAQPEPGTHCYFQYQGKKRQVVLGFEIDDGEFKSYDRGVDPDTGKSLWGALMGPYIFKKTIDYEWRSR